eukprot:RCo046941
MSHCPHGNTPVLNPAAPLSPSAAEATGVPSSSSVSASPSPSPPPPPPTSSPAARPPLPHGRPTVPSSGSGHPSRVDANSEATSRSPHPNSPAAVPNMTAAQTTALFQRALGQRLQRQPARSKPAPDLPIAMPVQRGSSSRSSVGGNSGSSLEVANVNAFSRGCMTTATLCGVYLAGDGRQPLQLDGGGRFGAPGCPVPTGPANGMPNATTLSLVALLRNRLEELQREERQLTEFLRRLLAADPSLSMQRRSS